MDVTPLVPKGRQIITGYGGGGFKINHEFVAGSLLVLPDHTLAWDGQLSLERLQPLLNAEPAIELLLLGTGNGIVMPDLVLRQALKTKGINVEVMDTGGACRTYNILMAEERRVAAALIAV